MSDEIDQTTGQAAVFVTGEPAWHKLGTVVSESQTSAQAMEISGLNYTVEKWPLTANNDELLLSLPTDKMATVRTDTNAVLGVVGKKYRVFQNQDAFDFMDAIVGEKLAMFETAGALFGGQRVWMLARIPSELRAGSDDIIHPYILLTNSHDGSQSLRMIPTTVRVVCWNTLNLALRSAGTAGLAIRHTSSLEARVEDARRNLGIITERMDTFQEELRQLTAKKMSAAEAADYFKSVIPGDEKSTQFGNALDMILGNFDNSKNSLAGIRHTAWGAYNSVSEWTDHQKTFKNTGKAREENRLNSIWFGQGNGIKAKAYANALALAS